MNTGLVLFAHGSRDPQWAEPFREIQRRVRSDKPDLAVELAFLEMMQPSLPDVVNRLVGSGTTRIVIAPLFMAQGAHLKRDLRKLITDLQKNHAQIDFSLLPAVGETRTIIDAVSTWLCAST
jgi:sirohydrochlorin cobaltochelatase